MPSKIFPDRESVLAFEALFDDLQLGSKIGESSFTERWSAKSRDLDANVVLRIMKPSAACDSKQVLAFIREARALARMDHPNILRVSHLLHKSARSKEWRVMVLEAGHGECLSDLVESKGRLAPDQVAEISYRIAKALSYAHQLGVIHTSLHSGQVFVSEMENAEGEIEQAVKLQGFGEGAASFPALDVESKLPSDPSHDLHALGKLIAEMLGDDDEGADAIAPEWRKLLGELQAAEIGAYETLDALAALQALRPKKHPTLSLVLSPQEISERTNISKDRSGFYGRAAEIAEIGEIFNKGEQLVSLLGPGGIGKTRLSKEYAWQALVRYEGGAWFADLSQVRDLAGISEECAKALGLKVTGGSAEKAIAGHLGKITQPTLLILDNFEQIVAEGADLLASWMELNPQIRFLVTSRESLRIDGESMLRVDPLDFALRDIEDSSGLPPALELFIENAQAIRPSFAPSREDLTTISEIAKKLDGLPLALKLAAAKVSLLSLKGILQRLDERFVVLRSRSRELDQRQRTMRSAIAWSWELLSEIERSALLQCTVFREGFMLEAAEASIDLSRFADAPLALDVVEALVEKSLIQRMQEGLLGGEPRYRLLESTRAFLDDVLAGNANQEVAALPDMESLAIRHAEYYLAYCSKWNALTKSRQAIHAYNRIAFEYGNVFEVQRRFGGTKPELAAKAILTIHPTLRTRGPWPAMLRALDKAKSDLGDRHPRIASRLHTQLGTAYLNLGDGKKAMCESELSIQLARLAQGHAKAGEVESGESQEEATRLSLSALGAALNGHGLILESKQEYESALAAYSEAEEINQANGNHSAMASALSNQSNALMALGRLEDAMEASLKAETNAREAEDPAMVANILGSRGIISAHLGKPDESLAEFQAAEAISRSLRDMATAAVHLGNQGHLLITQGKLKQAWEVVKRAESLTRSQAFAYHLAFTLLAKANIAFQVLRDQSEVIFLREGLSSAVEAIEIFERMDLVKRKEYANTLAYALLFNHHLSLGEDGDTSAGSSYHAAQSYLAKLSEKLAKPSWADSSPISDALALKDEL